MGVFAHLEAAWILVGERGNRNTRFRIVFCNEPLSQYRYIMTQHQSCDNREVGPS